MKHLNQNTVGVIVGLFIGGWHLLWSVLILFGFAQPLLNFIFWMHMLTPVYHVTGFTLMQSVTLIIITCIIGYVCGWIFAWLWNIMHKERE